MESYILKKQRSKRLERDCKICTFKILRKVKEVRYSRKNKDFMNKTNISNVFEMEPNGDSRNKRSH